MVFYILSLFGVGTFTFLHWLLAISITLLLLDCFVQTEMLSIFAIVLFVEYFGGILSNYIPFQWFVVTYFLLLIIGFFLYVTLWRNFVYIFIRKTLLRNAVTESYNGMVGKNGTFRVIDDKDFVDWNGELWQIAHSNSCNFYNGEEVFIVSNNNGKLTIAKRE